jgi:hypothetical protein
MPFDKHDHADDVAESDDTESVSAFGLQCSLRTPSKKMQPPWVLVSFKAKSKAPTRKREIEKWLAAGATAGFKKGGEHTFYVARKIILARLGKHM